MIPADVASRLRFVQPDQPAPTKPVTPAPKLQDVLSDLKPGQRILAEIQSLLPNGTYRAVVAQREITLALPFSAKAGDALELEVIDNDGNIALALVANRSSGEAASKSSQSVATTFSQTGRLIGDLLGEANTDGKRAPAAPLNGNQPLTQEFPDTAAELAPTLKNALTQSGVFYEAHQARWVTGELPTEALRQEPQGRIAVQAIPVSTTNAPLHPATNTGDTQTAQTTVAQSLQNDTLSTGSTIPKDLTPIVQQQLDALATQNYAWQGQIWPGQRMWWEIADEGATSRENDTAQTQWRTRLKLSLPNLGQVDATIRLQPGVGLVLSLTTDSQKSEALLRNQLPQLGQQLEAAGMALLQAQIIHGEITD